MEGLDLMTLSCMVKDLSQQELSKNKQSDDVDTPMPFLLLTGRRTLPLASSCSISFVLYDPKDKQVIQEWFHALPNRCRDKDESAQRCTFAFPRKHAVH